MKKTLLLDAGHGGLNSKGQYTTPASNGKFWKHNRGIFHKGSTFYEGVSNRVFADSVKRHAESMGIKVIKVYDPILDTSLSTRVNFANTYSKFNEECYFLSLHSDAINKQDAASGFSIFTSPKVTKSDAFATAIWNAVNKDLSGKYNFNMRSDMSDGDPDYEKAFDVLAKTSMPAALIENQFFDNYNGAMLLMNKQYQEDFGKVVAEAILPFLT